MTYRKARPVATDDERQAVQCGVVRPGSEAERAIELSGLVYTSDCRPGIRRVPRAGGTFTYRYDDGRRVDSHTRARIEALKIPPAWSDVWICAEETGHLQATGRDSRGRKQYRYHDGWRAVRDESKYERLILFGEALPGIRAQVDRDLRRPTLDRQRVLALLVAVLDDVLIRVGNPRYARENESFGLTTLRSEHADITAGKVRLRFRGKAGHEFSATIDNPRIARAMRRVNDLPGQELFQYVDQGGDVRVVGSGDVNDYLREAAGAAITSKDFRTWGGNLTLAESLHERDGEPTATAVVAAVKEAAAVLGNTPAVCRRSYIHPALIDLYLNGGFPRAWALGARSEPQREFLGESERVFLGLLRRVAG